MHKEEMTKQENLQKQIKYNKIVKDILLFNTESIEKLNKDV